jgi:ATP-dependent DNA ligase
MLRALPARELCGDVHLCAFDLVELDGPDLRLEPQTVRRTLMARLVRKPRCGLVPNERFDQPIGVRARLSAWL